MVTVALVFVFVIAPSMARAFPVTVIADIPAMIRERVELALKDSFGYNVQLALINAMQAFGQRLSYETAVWIASGGPGQGSLLDKTNFGDFIAETAFNSGLEMIDTLDRYASTQLPGEWAFEGGFGVTNFICAPALPQVRLGIKLGLQNLLQPVQPRCTFKDLDQNWSRLAQQVETTGFLSQVGVNFEGSGETDLGAALEAHTGIGEVVAQKALTKLNERIANKSFKPVSDFISKNVKTPASVVEEKLMKEAVGYGPKNAQQVTDAVQGGLQSIDTFVPMLKAALTSLLIQFGSTLISQTIQKQIIEGGLFAKLKGQDVGIGRNDSTPSASSAASARALYAEFVKPRFASGGNYDQLALFVACDPQRRTPTSCVIDQAFADAVRRNPPLTVAEAVAATALHDEWPLIPAGSAEDQQPDCYTKSYCGSNLAKLRAARIIPVGWEMAANHPSNRRGAYVTFGDARNAFNRNGDDGVCGTGDANESPYCGLIDSNWVLRYFDEQCLLRAPTELLADAGTNRRSQECRDVQSCLEKDADGRCAGRSTDGSSYGYCIREQNVWRLGGQSCPAYAASCRAFTSRTGQALPILTSTIDRSQCSAGGVGCAWFASRRDAAGNWVPDRDRRYFNKEIEQCTATAEGCSELLPTAIARTNLVPNGGFDRDTVGQAPAAWTTEGVVAALTVREDTPTDGPFLRCSGVLHGNAICRTQVASDGNAIPIAAADILSDTRYTLTASIRVTVSAATPVQDRVRIAFQDAAPPFTEPCQIIVPAAERDGQWRTYRVTCTTGVTITNPRIVVTDATNDAVITTVDIDRVQLELGETPSQFHEGYAPDAPKRHLRVATPDLRCDDRNPDGTLNRANDHPSCASFARACVADDVGCERYTPLDQSPVVLGRYGEADRCPAACVGYAAFREVPSAFDERQTFDFFIPSTARQCTATEVGCSEFTSIDPSGRGGEARAYFSFLRRCRRPADNDANPGTFYTWEGSGESGYQIRRFTLATDVAWQPPVGSTRAPDDRPPFVNPDARLTGGRGIRAANPQDTNGETCERFYGQSPVLPNGSPNPDHDSELSVDCRAFYTPRGSVDYRLLSRTVVITDACTSYRLTHQIPTARCTGEGGTEQQNTCVIRGAAAESLACAPAANGCRAYRGSSGGALRTILATDFETAVGGQFQQRWVGGTSSLESLLVGGRSLEVLSGATATYRLREVRANITDAAVCQGLGGILGSANAAGDWQVAATGTCALPLVKPGATYEVLSVARGGTVQMEFRDGTTVLHEARAPVTLGTTWQRVTVGPFLLGTGGTAQQPTPPPTVNSVLAVAVTGRTVHLDQVILRESPTTVTVVKGSWVTPPSCDRASIAPDAAPQAQGMLGCRAYRDRSGQVATLRSFAKLCGDEVVGCTAFADTAGSSTTRAQRTFANGPTPIDDITVPADATRYLVDDPAKSCAATAKGCRRFGRPVLNRTQDRLGRIDPAAWTDVYLRDDPDRYEGPNAILCPAEQLFCEEYRASGGAVAYFKDPGNRTCEYREKVEVNGIPMDGWFRVGTTQACDPVFVIGGTTFGIWRNGDAAYDGWIGTCSPERDQCTEFRDPSDRSFAEPEGKRYFAIRTSLDFGRCTGSVSPAEGCVALDEVANPAKLWSAGVSNRESTVRQNERVASVDCDRNPAACQRCVLQRRCLRPDGTARPTSNPGQRRCLRPDGTPAPTPAPATCTTDVNCNAVAGSVCGVSLTCTADTDCDRTRQESCSGGGLIGPTCTSDAACAAAPGVGGAYRCARVPNDTNVIVKVTRDRRCSQWYEKDGCVEAFDQRVGRATFTCSGIRLTGLGGRAITRPDPSYLTIRTYQGRDRSSQGEEYTGYAIPGRAGLEFLEQVVLERAGSGGTTPERRALLPVYCPARSPGCGDSDGSCAAGTADLASCGATIGGASGQCFQGRCTYPPLAADPALASAAGLQLTGDRNGERPVCKAYPEEDSPFSRDTQLGVLSAIEPRAGIAPLLRFASQAFTAVNLCEDEGTTCECKYQRAKYGDAPRYFGFGKSVGATGGIPPAICVGGRFNGLSCDPDFRCAGGATDCSRAATNGRSCQFNVGPGGTDGNCQPIDRNDPVIGIDGYCLERDESVPIYGRDDPRLKACRVFYPVDQLEGSPDLNNQVESAGYRPTGSGGRFMCVQARGNALPMSDRSQVNRPREPTKRTYPTAPESVYWVAARLESQYSNFSSPLDDDDRALFSNSRGPQAGDTSGLETHPITGEIIWNGWALRNGQTNTVRPYRADASFLDRVPPSAIRNVGPLLMREEPFWTAHSRSFHRGEIAEIRFIPALGFDETEGFTRARPQFSLHEGNGWAVCIEKEGTLVEGRDGTQGPSSQCWAGPGLPNEEPDSPRFNETGCRGNEAFLGAKARFTSDNRLDSLQTGLCSDPSSDGTGSADDEFSGYDIYFRFREACVDVVRVAGESAGSQPRSKPWTDRIWGRRNPPYLIEDNAALKRSIGIPPFGAGDNILAPGSTGMPFSRLWNILPSTLPAGVPGWNEAPPGPAGAQGAPTVTPVHAGLPYSCSAVPTMPLLQSIGQTGPLQCSILPDPVADPQSRSILVGTDRVHSVFANFIERWRWEEGCAFRCVGGPFDGMGCRDDSVCRSTSGTCEQNVGRCDANTGAREGVRCRNNNDCRPDSGLCEFDGARSNERTPVYMCATGARAGQTCARTPANGDPRRTLLPAHLNECQGTQPGSTCVVGAECQGGVRDGERCASDADCRFTASRCDAVGPTCRGAVVAQLQYQPVTPRDPTADVSSVGMAGAPPTVPVVAGIGPCDATSGECLEIPILDGTFTVNNINGRTDPGIVFQAGGRLRTRFQFFFRADQNQMPIRQVAVDYGDGSHYLPGEGSYQNRRGLKTELRNNRWVAQAQCVGGTYDNRACDAQANGRRCGDDPPARPCDPTARAAPGAGTAQNLTCQVADTASTTTDGRCVRSWCDGANFGRSPEACTTQPFALTHTYLCNPDALPDCTGPGNGPDVNQAAQRNGCRVRSYRAPNGQTYAAACVYVPRILAKDNWGHCATNFAGGCPNAPAYRQRGDGQRCFDGRGLVETQSDPLNTNECNPSSNPRGGAPDPNPWVYFGGSDGRIIVAP